jgi:tetratricopeptide (TPR) repeat protein
MSPDEANNMDKSNLEQQLQETKQLLENIKSMGADVQSAEIIISQAEQALENQNLDIAKALIDSTINTAKLIRQQHFIQAASILFSSLQRSIVGLEGAGREVNYIKDLYNKAKEKFDTGQYEEAMDYIKTAEDMAHDLKEGIPEENLPPESSVEATAKKEVVSDTDRSQQQMERVSQVLIRVEQLLQEAVTAGYAVNEAEKMYSLAEDAFDYQDYKKAETYAIQSERSLDEILEPLHEEKKRLEGETVTQETVKEQMKFREDLPTGDTFVKKPKTYSDTQRVSVSSGVGQITDEETMDEELAMEKEATNLLITADEKINEAKSTGQNLPMAERLLAIAESYFDRAEYDIVKEYASKAIKQIDEMMSHKGQIRLSGKRKKIMDDEAEDVVAEVKFEPEPKPEPEVEPEPEPEPEVESEIQESAPVESDEASIVSKPTKASEKLEARLLKVEADINKAKELGIEVEEAQDLLAKAMDEFNKNEFITAKDFGLQAKKFIDSVKKDFVRKKALEMIKYAWKEIEIADEDGVETSVASTLLQDARNQIKEKKFKKAAELAMRSIQSLKSAQTSD